MIKEMKTTIIGIILFVFSVQGLFAQTVTESFSDAEKEIIRLSKDKWQWMADKKVDVLDNLFLKEAMFVHMGGSWGKEQEINVIKTGGIWYKKADIHDVTVNIIDNTAILLNRITLLAAVGSNEVTSHFMVTEVYIKQNGNWKMGSLTFSRLIAPPPGGSASAPDSH